MNIRLKAKKAWDRYRNYRQLRSYYRSVLGKGGGEKNLLSLLLFFLGSLFIFQASDTLGQSLPGIFFLIVIILIGRQFWSFAETGRMRKICQQQIARKEFLKRLERASSSEVLQYLAEKIVQEYDVTELEMKDNYLQGTLDGEKLALAYRYYEQDEVMSTQEMIALLRECERQKITWVRVFTNTDTSVKAKGLGERFGLDLRIYDGAKLLTLLQESPLYPTDFEIEAIIKKESAKRLRRLAILRNEAVRGNKYLTYFIYSGLLLGMAWLRIGFFYLNVIFGLVLLGLGFTSLVKAWPRKEEDTLF